MIDLIFILFIIASLLSIFKVEGAFKHVSYIIMAVVLILMAAFRGKGVDNDYGLYTDAFDTTRQYHIDIEITFVWISQFVRTFLFNNIIYLFLIYAALGVSLKFIAIKQLTNLWFLSILIYIANFYMLHELTQIRAGVASGLLLLSIKPLYERNIKQFILFALAAVLFHSSALIIFLFWFFDVKKINKIVFMSLIPLAYILNIVGVHLTTLIYLIPIPLIQVKFEAYNLILSNGEMTTINIYSVFTIIRIFICLFLTWKVELITKSNKYVIILLKIYILSCCLFVLLSDSPTIAFRLSELLEVVEIILIPVLIYGFSGKRWVKSFLPISLGVFLMWLLVFYSKLIK